MTSSKKDHLIVVILPIVQPFKDIVELESALQEEHTMDIIT